MATRRGSALGQGAQLGDHVSIHHKFVHGVYTDPPHLNTYGLVQFKGGLVHTVHDHMCLPDRTSCVYKSRGLQPWHLPLSVCFVDAVFLM